MLMARAVARPRVLHRPDVTGSTESPRNEVTARVETPAVESGKLEPVKPEPPKTESAPGLRHSTD
jgi:hypothetical protein